MEREKVSREVNKNAAGKSEISLKLPKVAAGIKKLKITSNYADEIRKLIREEHVTKIPITGTKYELSLQNDIGSGGFGVVYTARYSNPLDESRGFEVAVKLVYVNDVQPGADYLDEKTLEFYLNSGRGENFIREVAAYRNLSYQPNCSEYIVCLYHYFPKIIRDTVIGVFVLELMANDFKSKRAEKYEFLPFILSTLTGISQIHDKNLAHRDIKPANILRVLPDKISINSSPFKIGDPGLICGKLSNKEKECTKAGSPAYMSPDFEKKIGSKTTLEYSQKEDSWGWGMTLYEVLNGSLPINWRENKSTITKKGMEVIIKDLKIKLGNSNIPYLDLMLDLLKKSLILDWRDRFLITELLDYFEDEAGPAARIQTRRINLAIMGLEEEYEDEYGDYEEKLEEKLEDEKKRELMKRQRSERSSESSASSNSKIKKKQRENTSDILEGIFDE